MSADNPYFAAQDRLRSLIAARPYFAGLPAGRIITEIPADLAFWSDDHLNALDFGITIEVGKGESVVSSYSTLQEVETFIISIIHNPQNDPNHDMLTAQWEIVQAVHGRCVLEETPPATTEEDFFAVRGHQKLGSSDTKSARELRVTGRLRLL